MKRKIIPAAIIASTIILGGCASSLSGSSYTRSEARTIQNVSFGQVIAVREVMIGGTNSKIGAGAGAITGGMLGANIGSGDTTRTLGALAGALAGGMAGAAIEEGITRQPGLEITIRLDSGRTITIVQAADMQVRPGDRVRVIHGRYGARVSY